jgi:hypothetical protein
MRFTPVAFALTLAASVMAAPTATWETSTCECAPDNHGALGELANYGAHWYQCVYPFGNCIWNDVRILYI